MENLLLILVFIFGGIWLLSVILERFASPADPEKMARLSRWIYPLVGLLLVLSAARYFFQG